MNDLVQMNAVSEWRRHWPLVIAATAGVSLSAVSTASIGVMMEPIERDLGWSRTQISFGTSLVALIGMTLATACGVAIDRFGSRPVGLLAAALMCGGIALMSSIGSDVWQWWMLWAVVGIAASSMPTVWIAPVSALFNSGRGLAVAITLSGSGLATSLVPIMANSLVKDHGWRAAYLALGLIWAAVVLPLVLLFFRNAGSTAGQTRRPDPATLPGLTAREGFRAPAFWKLAFAAFLSMSAGGALVLNLVPVLRDNGLSPTAAASIAGLIGISTITGRIAGGWLMDRFSAALIAAAAAGGAAVLPLLVLLFPGSTAAAAAGVALYGLLGGAKIPALVYLASRHFGPRAFGALYGAVNTTVALGVGVGPVLANYVYDSTRSYEPVMWTAIPFVLLAAAIYATLGRYPQLSPSSAERGNLE